MSLLGRANQAGRSKLSQAETMFGLRVYIVPALESPRHQAPPASPKQGRCATQPAQHLGLGEFDMLEQRMRAILAQRPGLREKRVRKIPAWEKQRAGQPRLPAKTSEPFSAQKGRSLPRRDVVQTWANFGTHKAGILPSKDDAHAQAARRPCSGEPPWLSAAASPKPGGYADRPAQHPALGGLGSPCGKSESRSRLLHEK